MKGECRRSVTSEPVHFENFQMKIEMFRKGFSKINQGFGNGLIRKKKVPAFRQAALEYLWGIVFLILCVVGVTAHMEASNFLLLWTG
jgi:hypothetical protein